VSDQEEAKLPPGLDLLWGRRTRGQRGPKPGLDLESIVDAAIAVADAEGLAAVSMARVARELGFTTMSLYRYVASKDELLTLMWNASAAGAPTITGEGWRERLESWALAQHDLLQRRTWVLEMPLASPPAGPNSLAWIEQAVGALDGTGLLDSDKLAVVGLLSSYTLSEARMAHEEHSALARGGKPVDYAAVLRAVVDRQTYPTLYRMAHSGDIDDPEGDGQEASFRFGLERILDGVAALVATRNGRTAAR
jgi:AcrR family transcriptional regulator